VVALSLIVGVSLVLPDLNFTHMAPPYVGWDGILPWGTLGNLLVLLGLLPFLPQLWCL